MTEKILFRLGIVLLGAGAAAAFLQHHGLLNLYALVPPCLFHRISGIYCPGCGGTHAVKALLEGKLLSCLIYHPFVFYCFILYTVFMGSHTLEKLLRNRNKRKSSHKKPFVRGLKCRISYVYIGVIIVLAQWMLKNIILLYNIW